MDDLVVSAPSGTMIRALCAPYIPHSNRRPRTSASDLENQWGANDAEPHWRVWGKVLIYFGKQNETISAAQGPDFTIFTDSTGNPPDSEATRRA